MYNWLIVLGFYDTSTLVGHFVSSQRERERRDRRDSKGDEREGQGRKENEWKWRNRRNKKKNIPPLPLPAAKIAGLVQLLFFTLFSVHLYFQESNYIFICEMWLFDLIFFLNSANLICRDMAISKYFREPLGLRDNESRLYVICTCNTCNTSNIMYNMFLWQGTSTYAVRKSFFGAYLDLAAMPDHYNLLMFVGDWQSSPCSEISAIDRAGWDIHVCGQ